MKEEVEIDPIDDFDKKICPDCKFENDIEDKYCIRCDKCLA